jgi:hypothetical protein
MRTLNQAIMNQVFEVTDELTLDREAMQVALVLEGDGAVSRTAAGRIAITLPDTDDLGPFLAALPDRLRDLGV